MRFISPISAYQIVPVHEDTEVLADGTRRVKAPGYFVEFEQGAVQEWERDIAREKFTFRNMVKNMDGSLVDPIHRVSGFDTVTITDPVMRERVETAMLANADHGKPDGYIRVERPKLSPPWASYDELTAQGRRTAAHVAEKNLELAAQTGVPVETLIAYEKNREAPRPELIELYEAALPKPEPVEELIAG